MFRIESYRDDDDLLTLSHNVNFSYHAHLHRCMEFSFCIQGTLTVSVSGQQHFLAENTGIMIPPTAVHSYHAPSSCEYCTILFGRNHLPDFAALFAQRSPCRYSFGIDSLLRAHVEQCFSRKEPATYAVKSLLYHAADTFMQGNDFVDRDAGSEEVAVRILEYIQEHFRESLSLEDFANRMDYSYFYVSKLIKRNFGLPFTELLAQYRIANVCRLLDQHACSITEAALASGFGSIRNFNRVFRQSTGLTPREYLRRSESSDDHALRKQ